MGLIHVRSGEGGSTSGYATGPASMMWPFDRRYKVRAELLRANRRIDDLNVSMAELVGTTNSLLQYNRHLTEQVAHATGAVTVALFAIHRSLMELEAGKDGVEAARSIRALVRDFTERLQHKSSSPGYLDGVDQAGAVIQKRASG